MLKKDFLLYLYFVVSFFISYTHKLDFVKKIILIFLKKLILIFLKKLRRKGKFNFTYAFVVCIFMSIYIWCNFQRYTARNSKHMHF